MTEPAEVIIVGAGAAGLMAAIWAGRSNPNRKIILLDGARKLGSKILVAGGGRCNVTHDVVEADAYAGSSRNAIKKVLRRFDVPETTAFFHELGVTLKREDTGKLFPTTDSARTVLDALLSAAQRANVTINHPFRVVAVEKQAGGFRVYGDSRTLDARSVILATGGKSLPKTGSDGHGYELARSLGHRITPRILPGLVPLTLPKDYFLCSLSGLSVLATLDLRIPTGKRLISFTDSTLCTHFGLSGPSVLDMSRYYLSAKLDDPGIALTINFLPQKTAEQLEQDLQGLGRSKLLRYLGAQLPDRLARALCAQVSIDAATPGDQLTREQRKALAYAATQLALPITGDRGYNFAEVTAGGVPLAELHLETMESRVCPGLYLCGEICDVDGRIGGYNFQWAWASGYTAGVSV